MHTAEIILQWIEKAKRDTEEIQNTEGTLKSDLWEGYLLALKDLKVFILEKCRPVF